MPTPKRAKKSSDSDIPFGDFPQHDEPKLRADDLRRARVPSNFWGVTHTVCTESAVHYVANLEENLRNGRGLLLFGPHGVGKTYTAAAILKAALRKTRKGMFVWAPDLVNAYKPDPPMYDDETTLKEAFEDRVILVIDDLGNEYRGSNSGFAEQHIVNLYRSRCARKRATIITTNLLPDDLEKTYGPGFRSLLAEFALAVRLKGEDRRRSN